MRRAELHVKSGLNVVCYWALPALGGMLVAAVITL